MKAALLSWLKFTVIGVLIQAAFAIALNGHDPLDDVSSRLDAPNWVGYWIFMPLLFGLALMLLSAAWDLIFKRKSRGEWPKP